MRTSALPPLALSPFHTLILQPPGVMSSHASLKAVRWRDRLLVGRIFDEGFLDCTLAAGPGAAPDATPPEAGS